MTDGAPRKTCTKCRLDKPETVFGKDGHGRRGSTCNTCRNEKRRARGEHARRIRPRETSEDRHARLLWFNYKLTPEQYAVLLDAQGGVCAICRRTPGAAKRLAVDHCHATGVVRALLCIYCNVTVGRYEAYREAVAAYLATYGAGNPLIDQ
jgi:hypothetical protein